MGWRRRPPRRLHPQLVLHGPLARARRHRDLPHRHADRAPARPRRDRSRPARRSSSTSARHWSAWRPRCAGATTRTSPSTAYASTASPALRRAISASRRHAATRTLETRRCRGQSMSCGPSSPSCASASPASQMRWPADCGPRATHGPKHNASPTRRARESPNSSGDPAAVCVASTSDQSTLAFERERLRAAERQRATLAEREGELAGSLSDRGTRKPSAQPGASAPRRSRRSSPHSVSSERRAALEPPTAPYLTVALGPLPEHSRGRHTWDQAAHRIEAYRFERGITDPRSALGAAPRAPPASALAASTARPRASSAALGRAVDRGPDHQLRGLDADCPGGLARCCRRRARPVRKTRWPLRGSAATHDRSPRGRTPPQEASSVSVPRSHRSASVGTVTGRPPRLRLAVGSTRPRRTHPLRGMDSRSLRAGQRSGPPAREGAHACSGWRQRISLHRTSLTSRCGRR